MGKKNQVAESLSVKDRVQKWQEQGAGIVELEDDSLQPIVEELSNDCAKSFREEDTFHGASRSQKKQSRVPLSPLDLVSPRGSLDKAFITPEARHTPSKRVMSDGHWRTKRSPPKETPISKRMDRKTKLSRRDTPDRISAVQGSTVDETREDGCQPLKAQGKSRTISLGGEAVIDFQRASELALLGERRRESNKVRQKREKGSLATSKDQKARQSSHEGNHRLSQKARSSSDCHNIQSEKRGLPMRVLQQTCKSDRKPAGLEKHPLASSIEAWLEHTSDPFLDDDAEQEPGMPPNAIPRSSEEKRAEEKSQDPERIGDRMRENESTTPKQRRTRTSQGRIQEPELRNSPIRSACSTPVALSVGTARDKIIQPSDSRPEGSISPPMQLKRRAARKSTSSPVRRRRKPLESTQSPSVNDTAMNRHSVACSSRADTLMETAPADHEDFDSHPKHSEPSKRNAMFGEKESADDADITKPAPECRESEAIKEHSDLLSMLSVRDQRGERKRSARRKRAITVQQESASISEILSEIAAKEEKYASELLTLVEGVIPVLLSCVLSKSQSAVAAGLLSTSRDSPAPSDLTRPVIEMGIALERLKSLHRRMPCTSATALLTWAHGAHKVYTEYIRSWRLGFQDVVVNLACLDEKTPSINPESGQTGLQNPQDVGAARPNDEKVEVGFLLKRPLVRLKQLSNALQRINDITPSREAQHVVQIYHDLVAIARSRVEEERARLEDEAAASVDISQAKNLHDLRPAYTTAIDRTKHVRARDNFNFTLHHSNGQSIDCRAELILRGSDTHAVETGDLLICGIDQSNRWLLFPPFPMKELSARPGRDKDEVVVESRGVTGLEFPSKQHFTLSCEDESISSDWLRMLDGCSSQSFHELSKVCEEPSRTESRITGTVEWLSSQRSQKAGCEAIGKLHTFDNISKENLMTVTDSALSRSGQDEPRPTCSEIQGEAGDSSNSEMTLSAHESHDHSVSQSKPQIAVQRSLKEVLGFTGTSAMTGLRRTKARRRGYRTDDSVETSRSLDVPGSSKVDFGEPQEASRIHECTSRVSSECSPMPFKAASMSHLQPENTINLQRSRSFNVACDSSRTAQMENLGSPADGLGDESHGKIASVSLENDDQLATAKHCRPPLQYSPNQNKNPLGDSHSRHNSAPPEMPSQGHDHWKKQAKGLPRVTANHPLSPLKHHVEVSPASETQSDGNSSSSDRDEVESMTESSDDGELEFGDVASNLPVNGGLCNIPKNVCRLSSDANYETSIRPSDSASQAPCSAAPAPSLEAIKTIASIYSWSNQGSWTSLHPDECSIVLLPGRIEAFEMSAAHSTGQEDLLMSRRPQSTATVAADSDTTSQDGDVQGERPLIALELTPLVALHRGTALDISIRSSLTSNSRIKTANHVMFRSRSSKECEALYDSMNHARIHNPTYIALQNARGPFANGASYGGAMDRYPGSRASHSKAGWFGGLGRSPSYRASTKRASSIPPSDNSIGTMASAFSAFKRLGRGSGGIFNIGLSTITSRNGAGSGANSIYASSDHSSGSGIGAQIGPGMVANTDGSLGLKDAKIRLYIRETASRWRDLGAAKLTILQSDGKGSAAVKGPLGQGFHEKRILIHGKTRGEVLLDTQLGESCFERVARTGIALSIWEDVVGPNGEVGVVGAVGGVAGGRSKVYMIQVSPNSMSPRLTALTFLEDEERSGDCVHFFTGRKIAILAT